MATLALGLAMTKRCPCCGQEWPAIALSYDLKRRRMLALRFGNPMKLSRIHVNLLTILLRAQHHALSADDVARLLWRPDNEPSDPRKNVHVHIRELRRRIGPLGLQIDRTEGGYRLIEGEKDERPGQRSLAP